MPYDLETDANSVVMRSLCNLKCTFHDLCATTVKFY